jgi:hypothetical protein
MQYPRTAEPFEDAEGEAEGEALARAAINAQGHVDRVVAALRHAVQVGGLCVGVCALLRNCVDVVVI